MVVNRKHKYKTIIIMYTLVSDCQHVSCQLLVLNNIVTSKMVVNRKHEYKTSYCYNVYTIHVHTSKGEVAESNTLDKFCWIYSSLSLKEFL